MALKDIVARSIEDYRKSRSGVLYKEADDAVIIKLDQLLSQSTAPNPEMPLSLIKICCLFRDDNTPAGQPSYAVFESIINYCCPSLTEGKAYPAAVLQAYCENILGEISYEIREAKGFTKRFSELKSKLPLFFNICEFSETSDLTYPMIERYDRMRSGEESVFGNNMEEGRPSWSCPL